MRFLRWLYAHQRLYAATSALLVLLAASVVGWHTNRNIDAARELPLVKSLGGLAATIEGGTINSQAMGAAILSGLENQQVKKAVLGQLPADAPQVVSGLDALRRQFIAAAVFLVDAQGKIVAYSGEDNEKLAGRDVSGLPFVQLSLQGTPNVYPAMGTAENGRGIYLAAPVRAANGRSSGAIGVVVVKVGAEKLDMVLESWTDGVAMLLSPKGEVFSASHRDWTFHTTGEISARRLGDDNTAAQSGSGLERTRIPGRLFTPDSPETTIEGVHYAVHSVPLEWHDPEGGWRLVVLGGHPEWWADWPVFGLSGMTALIVALALFWLYTLARHENALFKSDTLLRESQSIAALASYVLDIKTGLIEVSHEMYTLFGIEDTYECSIAGWLELVHPDDRALVERDLEREILSRTGAFNEEYRILRRSDGVERWVHALGRFELDARGQPIRMRGTVQDVTERKQAENALRWEYNQSQHYLETTLALMVELDCAGNITMINRAAENLLGYATGDLLGRNWFETCLLQPAGKDVAFPVFRQLMAGEIKSMGDFETLVLCRDGSRRLVAWRNSVLTEPGGKLVGTLSSGLDVTETRKLAQQLETILEKSPTGIIVFREDGPCIMANEAYARLVGTTHEEAMKQDYRNNASWQRNGLLDFANQAFATQSTVRSDIQGITSFGKRVALECIFAPISLSGKPHLLLLVNDVMDRVEAQRALNESMRQLQHKESSKTRFLAAAGHDLRQPIAAANLFVGALKHSSPTEHQSKLIQRLEQSMDVFSGLLDCLLDISKLDAGLIKPKLAMYDLSQMFSWLDQHFSQVAHAKQLRFNFHFPGEKAIVVRTDIDLLQSIVMNLVSNALKFTRQGGILVSARLRGDSVLFQVWDTGIGISEAHLPYIFDEFFQVSNPQRDREGGLGLGLASCQRRMSLLGGKVTCRSRLGRGSVFELRLPLKDESGEIRLPQAATGGADVAVETFVSGKRVVVLEDDRLVSDAMRVLLEALGADVRLFHNAEHALQHDDIGDADYFIVDHSLGGELSGLQFLESLQQKQDARVRAVILTGETSTRFLSSVSDIPWPVLNKPISLAELATGLNR